MSDEELIGRSRASTAAPSGRSATAAEKARAEWESRDAEEAERLAAEQAAAEQEAAEQAAAEQAAADQEAAEQNAVTGTDSEAAGPSGEEEGTDVER